MITKGGDCVISEIIVRFKKMQRTFRDTQYLSVEEKINMLEQMRDDTCRTLSHLWVLCIINDTEWRIFTNSVYAYTEKIKNEIK